MLSAVSAAYTLLDPTGNTWGFGASVATTDKWTVVGSPQADDLGFSQTGLAYVFDSSGTLKVTLHNPSPGNDDNFGYSVAVDGDTVVIGAVNDNSTGSAFVFNALTGTLLRTLNDPLPPAANDFGTSVGVSGNTIVVGSTWAGGGYGLGAGSAYLFDATNGSLLFTLANPNPTPHDRYGTDVAVSGQIAVVGSHGEDMSATDAGAAYVFDVSTGSLVHTLNHPDPHNSDSFGISVAASGNVVVIGASGYDPNGIYLNEVGRAWVFDATTGDLTSTLINPSPATPDNFGASVAVSGQTVLVGAFGDDVTVPGGGAAYLFDAFSGNLLDTLCKPSPVNGDRFGRDVAISANRIAIAAPGDDTAGADSGAVYVVKRRSGIGNFFLGSIHGVKFDDADNDGVRDPGEQGVPFVRVYLDTNDDSSYQSTEPWMLTLPDDPSTSSIDEAGSYWFMDLGPGTYQVREEVPAYATQTSFPPPITMQSGDVWVGEQGRAVIAANHVERLETRLDIGNHYEGYGAIHGCKFNDLNGNGIEDDGEPPLKGVTFELYLLGGDGLSDLLATTGTASTGAFWFDGLRPGTYRLVEVPPPGAIVTTPPIGDIVLAPGQTVSFGDCPMPGSIHGQKFIDGNGNGRRDLNEPGRNGVTIQLCNAAGQLLQTTQTMSMDVNKDGIIDRQTEAGLYWFDDLRPGTYIVKEVLPEGTFQTLPAGNGSYTITVTSGQVAGGNQKPVFNDMPLGTFLGQEAVATCYSATDTGAVLAVLDLSAPPLNVGANSPQPMYKGPATQMWTRAVLGNIFGVTLDELGNIYVTATSSYNDDFFGPGGSGAVYKIANHTGAITTFAQLPNTSRAGLGNISYDEATHVFYVSNFEDGRIYALKAAGTGSVVLSTFDHATDVITSSSLPELDDDPNAFAPLGERVWGVQAHNGRLYYGLWSEDSGRPSASDANEVWSVGLAPGGAFVFTSKQLEITLPPFVLDGQVKNYSNPVSDISFGPTGTLLAAERSMFQDTGAAAHQSRVLEYRLVAGWTPTTNTFAVGDPIISVASSAGGVDYDYSAGGRVWVSGDALLFGQVLVYGVQGLKSTGGNISNSILIDLNGNTSEQDKTQIGDVELPRLAFDFGNYDPVEFHGIKFEDQDGNGVQDPGEKGLAGWTITVTGTDGMGNPVSVSTVTMADDPSTENVNEAGMYWITGLKPGTYTVQEQQQPGWIGTAGSGGYSGTFSSGYGSTSASVGPIDTEITLVAAATGFNSIIGIDYHEPSNSVVVSANYALDGKPQNFERINSDGSHTPFSSQSGFASEVKIASVRSGYTGGFTVGDLFTGNGNDGEIARITNGGNTIINPFVSLPGNNNGLLRGSLYVDRTGVFGGDLIAVTTFGEVWRIAIASGAVVPTKLASLGRHLEGLVTVPDDPLRYGPLAGKILVGAEDQHLLFTISLNGDVKSYDVGVAIEDIDLIPANENFYGINYGSSRVLSASASEFTTMVGDILLTQEKHSGSGLFRLTWNGTALVAEPLTLSASSETAAQWEHVTFAPAGIDPIPATQFKFGNYRSGSVHGMKFEDSNANGKMDVGEKPLPGWTITLTGRDGMGNAVKLTTTTMTDDPTTPQNEAGMFWFSNLQPGVYSVGEVPQAGWVQTAPSAVISGNVVTDNFHRLYSRTGTLANPIGTVNSYPAVAAYSSIISGEYLYIAAWSDDGVQQGLLADLMIDATTVLSGDLSWEVFATDNDFDSANPPSSAQVTAAINGTSWVSPAVGGPNDHTFPGPNPWPAFTAINNNSRWMWYDSGSQSGINAPFNPGFDHKEFLLFRTPLHPLVLRSGEELVGLPGQAMLAPGALQTEVIVGAPLLLGNSQPRTNRGPDLDPSLVINPLPFSTGVDNRGTLVGSIINGAITDTNLGDPRGMAVISANNTEGQWQYSINGGGNWIDFADVSATSAVVIGTTTLDRVRFVPVAGFTGIVSPGLTFRAWDQSDGLADGTTGVDASQGGGESPFSDDIGTATISVVQGRVVLDPIFRFPDSQPQLSWQPVPGAVRYEMWFSRAFPNASRIYSDTNITSTSWTPPASLAPAVYRYWVRAFDAAGNAGVWSIANTFEIRPTLISPLNGSFTRRPTFLWEAIPFAAGYTIFIRSSAGDQVVPNIVTTSYTPPADLPAGAIRWWIRATAALRDQGWSAAGMAGDKPHPVVTAPTSPTVDTTPTIAWTAIPGAGRYVLHLINVDTAQVVIRVDNLTVTQFTPVTALAKGNYRAWIKAIDGITNEFSSGLWSKPFDFTITATTIENTDENNDGLTEFGKLNEFLQTPEIATYQKSQTTHVKTMTAEAVPGPSHFMTRSELPHMVAERSRASAANAELAMLDTLFAQTMLLASLTE